MKLTDLIKDLRFDKRLTEWGIRYTPLKEEDFQNYLKSLPDLTDQQENILASKEEEVSE